MGLKELSPPWRPSSSPPGSRWAWNGSAWPWRYDRATADAVAQKLMDDYSYQRRGLRLVRLDTSYQLCSAPEHAGLIRKSFESRKPARLSPPALEVLAVIAYYQPTTRAYVDQVRGWTAPTLWDCCWTGSSSRECGRLAVPGRPILYRTTATFLRSFGLSSLEDLPELPAVSRRTDQLTLEMQARLRELEARQEAGEGDPVREGEGP